MGRARVSTNPDDTERGASNPDQNIECVEDDAEESQKQTSRAAACLDKKVKVQLLKLYPVSTYKLRGVAALKITSVALAGWKRGARGARLFEQKVDEYGQDRIPVPAFTFRGDGDGGGGDAASSRHACCKGQDC